MAELAPVRVAEACDLRHCAEARRVGRWFLEIAPVVDRLEEVFELFGRTVDRPATEPAACRVAGTKDPLLVDQTPHDLVVAEPKAGRRQRLRLLAPAVFLRVEEQVRDDELRAIHPEPAGV
jgi:hypothetical protein